MKYNRTTMDPVVIELYSEYGSVFLSEKLGAPRRTIMDAAKRLGIKRDRDALLKERAVKIRKAAQDRRDGKREFSTRIDYGIPSCIQQYLRSSPGTKVE